MTLWRRLLRQNGLVARQFAGLGWWGDATVAYMPEFGGELILGAQRSMRSDRWIRWTTTGCVALLVLIAGTVSYLHMRALVELHGQPGWVAALTRLSVDGMIVAAGAARYRRSPLNHSGTSSSVGSAPRASRIGIPLGTGG